MNKLKTSVRAGALNTYTKELVGQKTGATR